jgi:hypothetical protein
MVVEFFLGPRQAGRRSYFCTPDVSPPSARLFWHFGYSVPRHTPLCLRHEYRFTVSSFLPSVEGNTTNRSKQSTCLIGCGWDYCFDGILCARYVVCGGLPRAPSHRIHRFPIPRSTGVVMTHVSSGSARGSFKPSLTSITEKEARRALLLTEHSCWML